MTRRTLSRRHAIASGALAAVAAGLPLGRAGAQEKRLVVNTYHGLWEEAHRKHLVPAVTKATGVEPVLTPMLAVDVVARITAARSNPPFDAVLNDEGPFLATLEQDLFDTLDKAKLPNLKNIPPKFIDASGKGVYISAQIIGLAYNPEKIKTPPKSWDDLLRPEFKGRVGITGPGSSLGVAWLAETAKLHGGSEANLDPAFEQLKKLLPNVGAVAANPGQLTTLFQQGQIDISFSYLNLVMPLKARGVPIALAKPETGWVLLRNGLQVVKNTKSPDLAHAFINTYLSDEVQTGMASAPYYLAPTNRGVAFTGELAALGRSMDDLEQSVITDWAKINPQRSAMIERFNRETKA
jgi:putative spermidine/putrescine transport system substrate-binding protein